MVDSAPGTGSDLLRFLLQAVADGHLNAATGNAQRVAVAKILTLAGALDEIDVRNLDVEGLLSRFSEAHRADYTPASLATYKTRFRNAVAMYLAWLAGRSDWPSVIRPRPGWTSQRKGPMGGRDVQVELTTGQSDDGRSGRVRAGSSQTVIHQLPLRPDLLVQVELPVDLTQADADRVAAFVRSLAFDPPQSDNL